MHWKLGVEVDTVIFDVIPGTALIEGVPFFQAVALGFFDGAEVEIDRAFFPASAAYAAPVVIPTPTGIVVMFVGRVAEVDIGRGVATFNVNSHLELLNLMMPRNLFQAGCVNSLGDHSCTINLETFAGTVNGTAASGSTAASLHITALGHAAGYYALGKIKGLVGANAGIWRTIKDYVPGTPDVITLTNPYGAAPLAGDTFRIYPGCNKSLTDTNGCAKFSNQANFRGTPFVPQPEQAL